MLAADAPDVLDAPEASRPPDVASVDVDVDARIDGLVLSVKSPPFPFKSSPQLQMKIIDN